MKILFCFQKLHKRITHLRGGKKKERQTHPQTALIHEIKINKNSRKIYSPKSVTKTRKKQQHPPLLSTVRNLLMFPTKMVTNNKKGGINFNGQLRWQLWEGCPTCLETHKRILEGVGCCSGLTTTKHGQGPQS